MKALILTSVLALLSLTSVVAGNPKNVLTNVENHENGYTKEYTFTDENMRPKSKSVYEYAKCGHLQNKTTYKWDSEKGWTAEKNYRYEYGRDSKLAIMIYTEWDNELQAWSPKSQHQLHIYSLDGETVSIERIEVNNDINFYAAQ